MAWADECVRTKVESLDLLLGHPCDLVDPRRAALIPRCSRRCATRASGRAILDPIWGDSDTGRPGSRSSTRFSAGLGAPVVFGCQAPDSGNAEILARYGTELHKERYLRPLLENKIVSCFSMTEPQGGSDPTEFVMRAERDGASWVLNGEKWFTSNAAFSAFALVLGVTDA